MVGRAGVVGKERGVRSARLDLRLEAGELVVDGALDAELVKLAIDVLLAGTKRCQILETLGLEDILL